MTYPRLDFRTENGTHRLHGLLSTLVTTLCCVETAFAVRGGAITDWPPGTYMSFECAQFDAEVRLPQGGVIESVIAGMSIDSIELGVCEKSWNYNHPRENERKIKDTLKIHNRLMIPFFVEFYEDNVDWIKGNIDASFLKWPMVWQFGRIVRNSCSHNSISINDQNFIPVRWHSLEYGPNQHGRKIFGVDLSIGDVIILIIEMSTALDALGCPI